MKYTLFMGNSCSSDNRLLLGPKGEITTSTSNFTECVIPLEPLFMNVKRESLEYNCSTETSFEITDTIDVISDNTVIVTITYTFRLVYADGIYFPNYVTYSTSNNLSSFVTITGDGFGIVFSLLYKNTNFLILFDNSATARTFTACVEDTILTISLTESGLTMFPPLMEQGCGPKIRASLVLPTTVDVIIVDTGYRYAIEDNRLLVIATNDCKIFSSRFELEVPPNLSDVELKKYILSGFVYGEFELVNKNFLQRLLLTPFRNFINSYEI